MHALNLYTKRQHRTFNSYTLCCSLKHVSDLKYSSTFLSVCYMWMIFSLFEETDTWIKAIIFQIRATGTLRVTCKIVLKDFALHLKFKLFEKISFIKITFLSFYCSVNKKQWYCCSFSWLHKTISWISCQNWEMTDYFPFWTVYYLNYRGNFYLHLYFLLLLLCISGVKCLCGNTRLFVKVKFMSLTYKITL